MRYFLNGLCALAPDGRGTAVMEFALVAPLFLMMLFGIAGYGGYFWRAHTVQEAANDAARAALPGLTAAERRTLALASVASEMTMLGIGANRTSASVSESGDMLTVSVAYDGSRDAFLGLGMVPLPSRSIRRIAAVRLGGL